MSIIVVICHSNIHVSKGTLSPEKDIAVPTLAYYMNH